jgi:transcription antitermination factor NusA-like protein
MATLRTENNRGLHVSSSNQRTSVNVNICDNELWAICIQSQGNYIQRISMAQHVNIVIVENKYSPETFLSHLV